LHILRGGVDAAIQAELQRDLAGASTLVELIESTPGMSENCASSGVATPDAMVAASAPEVVPSPPVSEIHHRQFIDGKRRIAEQTGQKNRPHHQDGHHWALDKDLGDIHTRKANYSNDTGRDNANKIAAIA